MDQADLNLLRQASIAYGLDATHCNKLFAHLSALVSPPTDERLRHLLGVAIELHFQALRQHGAVCSCEICRLDADELEAVFPL